MSQSQSHKALGQQAQAKRKSVKSTVTAAAAATAPTRARRRDTGTGTDTDTDTGAGTGTGTGTPNREDQQDREQSFFIAVIHSHLSFSQRLIRNSFHSLRPSSVGSEAARRKKQQSREWNRSTKSAMPVGIKERGGVESGGRPDRKSSSQICETMRCIKSDRASKTPSTVSWSQQQLLGYSSM